MANNSDRSVEIPIYLKLDKASYDRVNAEIEKAASKATITTSDLRAKRGLPPRVSKTPPNLDMRQIAEKVAFEVVSSLGSQENKFSKAIAEKLGKTSFNLALPKITFDSQGLSELENLPDTIEELREKFNLINDVSLRLSKLTGIARTDVDISNLSEDKLFDLLSESLTSVQKRIIPGLAVLEEIYMQTLGLAGQYNIPALTKSRDAIPPLKFDESGNAYYEATATRARGRQQRSLPTGAFREFQDNAKTRAPLEQFRSQFDANPEAYSDAISKSIETWGKRILQDTLKKLRELPEGQQSVEAGAQTLTFWLDDAISKFRDNMLAAGFQPGTEIEIANELTNNLGETIGQAELLILDNLRNQYFTEESINLGPNSGAMPISEQIRQNPALLTQKRMGHGALQELQEINKQVLQGGTETEQVLKLQAESVSDGLEALISAGGQFVAAFDTEFVRETSNVITEAAVVLKDNLGNFYNAFDLLQMPPASQEQFMAQARVGARNRSELQKRAGDLGYTDPLGAEGGLENLQDFYPKLKSLIDVINKLAELGVPLATASGQAADFFSLAKAISNVNEGIEQNKLNLEPLLAPAGPYSTKTVQQFPRAFPLGMPDAGSAEDIQKISRGATGKAAAEINALAEGSTKVSNLLKGVFDQLSEEVKSLITITKDGFTFEGDPAHTARADAKVTAAIYEVLQRVSPAGASPKDISATPPSGGLGARPASGVPEQGYEPFLIQLKGMNSVLSSMLEEEKNIFLQKLKAFQTSKEQQKLYEKQIDIQRQISALQKQDTSDPAIKKRISDLQSEEVAIQLAGEANERRFAGEVKFNYRQDKFAGKTYDHFTRQVDAVFDLADADKVAQAQIIGNMKQQVATQKQVESQNKSLMNTWVTGRYALYDVGNAYEGVARQLAMVTRRIFEITNAFRSYETAFTAVERTLPALAASGEGAAAEMRSIKDALIDMSEVMPVAFEDLSQIATLGAQMGISASGIVEFTRTISQFASITGISIDTVSQKFGRIAELADVDASQFDNLGSAIAYAGINAVATEAEILTLAESIAAVSNMAGMMPAQTIGIATSLASIGIQAEQARGVFTRVFADIDRAVSKNGESLEAFANIAGLSVDQFAAAWGEEGESYNVFRALLGGLGAAENLTAAFDSLNIVETREINTLTRLAKNLNVVDQAASDATQAFEAGTFLGTAFEKTADNLDSKIQILNNNFKAFTESLSQSTSGVLINFIDLANDLLQTFKELGKNPLFQGAASAALGLTAIATAATFTISAMTKLVAQMYAFRVAAINTANDASSMTGIGSMLKQITGWGGGLVEVRKNIEGIAPAVKGAITPMNFSIFGGFEKQQKSLLQNNMLLLDSEKLGIGVARERADTINQVLRARQSEIATIAQSTTLTEAERLAKVKSLSANRLYVTTTGEIITAKISETEARKRNLIALNAESQAAVTAQRGLRGTLPSTILGVATGLGAVLTVATLAGTAIGFFAQQLEKTKINILDAGGGLASLRDSIRQDTLEYNKLTEAQKLNSKEYVTFNSNIEKNTAVLDPNAVAVGNITGLSSDFAEQNKKTTTAIETQTFALGQNTREWLANAIMQDKNFQGALEKYPTLLKDAEEAGYNFREVIETIFQDPNAGIDDVLPGILRKRVDLFEQARLAQAQATSSFDPQESAAFQERATAYEQEAHKLQLVQQAVESLQTAMGTAVGKNEVFNAIRDILGLGDALEDAEEGAEGLEEGLTGVADALRTVLDYASDLSGIFSRVIELEVGKQLALDPITKGWRDIAESAKNAADAINEAQQAIDDATADRSILEYQLSVAERYGDELRAAKIRAELAKVNDQIADSEERKSKAESEASMNLTGNTDAAIQNRATIIGLVGDYQKYIETLAKLGRSSSQLEGDIDVLKNRFREQAIAAGFSSAEIEEYVGLFDQFGQVAADAPRDVDIEVALGLTAAEQAINEFLAKDREMGVDVDVDTEDLEDKIETLEDRLRGLGIYVDITPAETAVDEFARKRRELGPIVADKFEHKAADAEINRWLANTRVISAQLQVSMDKQLARRQADYFLSLMRSYSVNSVQYESFRDLYLIMNRISNSLPAISGGGGGSMAFADGGLVVGAGNSRSDSIPAMLSDGEFVMKAAAVRQYGPDFFNSLNQQRIGFAPAASAVGAGNSARSQVVYLSPDDRALLRAVASRPVTLYADNTKIAQSANMGNKKLSQRGVR